MTTTKEQQHAIAKYLYGHVGMMAGYSFHGMLELVATIEKVIEWFVDIPHNEEEEVSTIKFENWTSHEPLGDGDLELLGDIFEKYLHSKNTLYPTLPFSPAEDAYIRWYVLSHDPKNDQDLIDRANDDTIARVG
jgi:hypothetical protein